MQPAASPIQLNQDDTFSIVPWIVAIVSLLMLLYTVQASLSNIPNDLLNRSSNIVSGAKAGDILLSIDGRDLSLSGTINHTVDRDRLVNTLRDLDGMRVVRDTMQVFNPVEQAKQDLAAFQQTLQNIDLSKVAFEQGSASITQGSRSVLFELVQILQAYPEFRVRVSGHTDNTGRPEVNLRISRERASAVADFLINNNIDERRILALGFGATRPIADNNTEAGRAANRRIEISYVN